MNEYLSFRFVSVSEYGRAISKEYIERFVSEVHDIEPRVNVPKLEGQVSNLLFRKRDLDNDSLYKSLSNMIIRNYRQGNRGVNDKIANKIIRRFVKDEIYGSVRLLGECKTLYGGAL